MNVLMISTIVIVMPLVLTWMDPFCALAILVIVEMVHFAKVIVFRKICCRHTNHTVIFLFLYSLLHNQNDLYPPPKFTVWTELTV